MPNILRISKRVIILAALLLGSNVIWSQKVRKTFSCPTNDGIVRKRSSEPEFRTKTYVLNIVPEDGKVLSVSTGVVRRWQEIDSSITLHIEFENYVFIYKRLRFSGLQTGEKVQPNQHIGLVNTDGSFVFSIRRDEVPVDPYPLLSCKAKPTPSNPVK